MQLYGEQLLIFFFRNIPQIIILIILYYKSVIINDNAPLLLFVTSCLKIFMPIFNYVCKTIILMISRRDFERNFYGKCEKCKRFYISPAWCRFCDPPEAIKGWTSEDKNIDNYIKGFQAKVTEYEKMIEWIPFNRLTNLQKVREEDSETIFMATWLDGIRKINTREIENENFLYYKGEPVEYTRSRIASCGVNLKILNGSQASDIFIENLTNYMKLEGNIIYGVTKDMVKNQYIMVVPDEFNSKRNISNGECIYCKHNNTSPAWCQSCDPWQTTQDWTSGNEEIDNSIKEFQIKATEYERVIEWIPLNRLVTLHKIRESNQEIEESNLMSIATWLNGVRTVKCEPGKYTQSRTISSVDLMKFNYVQMSTLDLLKNFIVGNNKIRLIN